MKPPISNNVTRPHQEKQNYSSLTKNDAQNPHFFSINQGSIQASKSQTQHQRSPERDKKTFIMEQ